MLKSLLLKNYMSYAKYVFDFSLGAMVAVCGDIGSGKSAMLEAINYTLYGVAKVSANKLIRIGAEAMECQLTLVVGENTFIVRRGVRKSKKGYLDIKLNDAIVAAGTSAQQYIGELLGVDSVLFMLTSFFGAGHSDTLIDALPARRLETMQKIANVDPFSQYYNDVKIKVGDKQAEIATLKRVLTVKRENLPDAGEINKKIKAANMERAELLSKIAEISVKRKALLTEVSRASILIGEQGELREVLAIARKAVGVSDELIAEMRVRIDDSIARLRKNRTEEVEISQKLGTFASLREVSDQLAREKHAVTALRASLHVYESGVTLSAVGVVACCPLCTSPVSSDTAETWKRKIISLKKDIARAEDVVSKTQILYHTVSGLSNDLAELLQEIVDTELHITDLRAQMARIHEKRKLECVKIMRTTLRLSRIEAELQGAIDVKDRLAQVDVELSDKHTRQGELGADIKNYRSQLVAREKSLKKIKADDRTLKKYFDELAALNLLREGFSRYGIPFDLLEGLKRRISQEASTLFSYFSDGVLEVKDIESRGKPGVTYVLVDSLGERDYAVWSTGEKVIGGLCIRLAVSFILRGALNINTDLLILDEIAGNLSPNKRDALVRVITGLLRKYFGQVFMVSHAALRDVFTDTFNISIVGGKSVVAKS